MTDVTIPGTALALFTAVVSALGGVIALLWRQVLGRSERAERQVDTLLPALNALTEAIRSATVEMRTNFDQDRRLQR